MDGLDWPSLNTVQKPSPCTYTGTSWPNGTSRTNSAGRTLRIRKEKPNSAAKPRILLPRPPTVPKRGEAGGGAHKDDGLKGLVSGHLQAHHGSRVSRWDPRGLEDQERRQPQQDLRFQGNHAPPAEGGHGAQRQPGVYCSPLWGPRAMTRHTDLVSGLTIAAWGTIISRVALWRHHTS